MAVDDGNERSARELAETVRQACERAAIEGYESARVAGLCAEGAFEAAVSAMRMLDLDALVEARVGASSRS